MAANKRRGEFEAEIGGKRYRFRLTMGALAEIEDANGGKPFAQTLIDAGMGGFSARQMLEFFRIVAAAQHPNDVDAIVAAASELKMNEAAALWTGMFKAAGIIADDAEGTGGGPLDRAA